LYVSEKKGSDETGDGTESKPFKTLLRAMHHAAKEPFPVFIGDGKEDGKVNETKRHSG
jgi:asparaginyl-tRNA synthetase